MIFVRDIQRATAEHYGLSVCTMTVPDSIGARRRDQSHPRQMAMFLSRRMTKKSYLTLSVLFGGRDHQTIIHGVRATRRRCLADRKHLEDLCAIRARVLGA